MSQRELYELAIQALNQVMGVEIPEGALYLGRADDGKPVMLNLYDDSVAGHIVFVSEGMGENFLRSAFLSTPSGDSIGKYAITKENWGLDGTFPMYERSSDDVIRSVAEFGGYRWSQNTTRRIVLFVENVSDIMKKMNQTEIDDFIWLLENGSKRGITIVASVGMFDDPIGTADIKYYRHLFASDEHGVVSSSSVDVKYQL